MRIPGCEARPRTATNIDQPIGKNSYGFIGTNPLVSDLLSSSMTTPMDFQWIIHSRPFRKTSSQLISNTRTNPKPVRINPSSNHHDHHTNQQIYHINESSEYDSLTYIVQQQSKSLLNLNNLFCKNITYYHYHQWYVPSSPRQIRQYGVII